MRHMTIHKGLVRPAPPCEIKALGIRVGPINTATERRLFLACGGAVPPTKFAGICNCDHQSGRDCFHSPTIITPVNTNLS
jgi:hypothetical protein